MASVKDVERLADDLQGLGDELRNEVKNGTDFERLMQIADQISEHADNAAETFSNVNETLMSRIGGLKSGRSRGSSARAKSGSAS